MAQAKEAPVPPKLRGYEYLGRLGSGGTATVYRYRQLNPDRTVAVKVPSPRKGGDRAPRIDPAALQRFRDEANMMAAVSSHPHILSIYGYGIDPVDGQSYMVLEYAPNGSYNDLVTGNDGRIPRRRLDADQMLDLGIKMAGALYTAHRAGFVHRDIKPANILITSQGQPALTDFGIATSVYRSAEATGYSLPWAAPEVLVGRGGDDLSDIYSLGATLFSALTSWSPFEYGRPRIQAMRDKRRGREERRMANDLLRQAILHEEIKPLNMPDVPAEVDHILRKAMSRDPADRYHSALRFGRAMQRVQQRLYGHATPFIAADTPQYPADMLTRAPGATSPMATDDDGRGRRWARPLAIGAMATAAVAAVAMVVVLVAMPRLDSIDATGTSVDTPGTGQGAGRDESPDAALGASSVPAPENLTGAYDAGGSTVTFTWTNPSPLEGDTYAWAPVGDAASTSVDTRIVDQPTVTVDAAPAGQTCIQVSIVRADRSMSTDPAIACAAGR